MRVAFFALLAALVKILTLDNLKIISGIVISHHLFADDTSIFLGANTTSVFCVACSYVLKFSGLKINLAKPELVYVGIVNNIEGLARILG